MVSVGVTAGNNPLIQVATTILHTNVDCATVIPNDNTIPQNTEGNEVITVSITPKSSSNILFIEFNGFAVDDGNLHFITCALFQDTTADALAASIRRSLGVNFATTIPLTYSKTAGTTSATTFKVRVGPTSATGTVKINDAFFGGVQTTSLTVWEYQA